MTVYIVNCYYEDDGSSEINSAYSTEKAAENRALKLNNQANNFSNNYVIKFKVQ